MTGQGDEEREPFEDAELEAGLRGVARRTVATPEALDRVEARLFGKEAGTSRAPRRAPMVMGGLLVSAAAVAAALVLIPRRPVSEWRGGSASLDASVGTGPKVVILQRRGLSERSLVARSERMGEAAIACGVTEFEIVTRNNGQLRAARATVPASGVAPDCLNRHLRGLRFVPQRVSGASTSSAGRGARVRVE